LKQAFCSIDRQSTSLYVRENLQSDGEELSAFTNVVVVLKTIW
jgi:hypothetical protein